MLGTMRAWSTVAFALLVVSCSDPVGESTTFAFSGSGCKSKMTGQALTSGPIASADYDGLECVAWEIGQDANQRAVFHLYNVEGGCGVDYAGRAIVEAGGKAVTLSLTNPKGAIAGCGWCVYDFTFQVQGPASNSDLTVAIERSNGSERGKEGTTTFTLPAQSRPTGVICSHGNQFAMQDHARKTGRSGARNFPCDTTIVTSNGGCLDHLTCTAVDTAGTQKLCLPTCSATADCGNADLYRCAAGVCDLATATP
jgi:hypothetical protein